MGRNGRTALIASLTAALMLVAGAAAADRKSNIKFYALTGGDSEHVIEPADDDAHPAAQLKPSTAEPHSSQSPSPSQAAPKTSSTAANKLPPKWSDAEVAAGRASCAAILNRIHAVAIAHEPIKEGMCGAPAPIELISIGQNPQVALSPPPIITCHLAEALSQWLEKDLQPSAQKHFSSPIIKIETMSSYSCRNAYGRKRSKLSEHALADALDIRGFVTASARTAYVLENWGTPQREIAEQIAAEKAAAAKQAAALAAASKAAQANLESTKGAVEGPAPVPVAAATGPAAAGVPRATIVDGIPKLTVTLPGSTSVPDPGALSIAEPDRLGGPVPSIERQALGSWVTRALVAARAEEALPERNSPERQFLHEAHDTACQIFGTTLGPEANAAHRNHLHVDMAPRPIFRICDLGQASD